MSIPRWFAVPVLALLAAIVVLLLVLVNHQDGGSTPQPSTGSGARAAGADDYTGAGTQQAVTVIIQKGWTGRDIANVLQSAGVVKSVQAYLDAANANQHSPDVQAGSFVLCTRG